MESQDVVVPVCVSAVLLACTGAWLDGDMLLSIIFAIVLDDDAGSRCW